MSLSWSHAVEHAAAITSDVDVSCSGISAHAFVASLIAKGKVEGEMAVAFPVLVAYVRAIMHKCCVPPKDIAAVTDDYCSSPTSVNLAHLFYQARRWTLYQQQLRECFALVSQRESLLQRFQQLMASSPGDAQLNITLQNIYDSSLACLSAIQGLKSSYAGCDSDGVLLQDYVEKIVADTAVLVTVRGAISGSAVQSLTTSQVTSTSGSCESTPWSTPTKRSPRGIGAGRAVEEKNVSGVQPVHANLPPAFNATAHASHVDDSSKELGQQQQQQQQQQQRRYNQLETQLVQDQQPHSTTIDQKESSDSQPDGAPQGRAKDESLIVESLIESHTAEIQRLTQEHDAAVAQQQQQQQQLQEQLRAAEETVVLLNLRTQRLEGALGTCDDRACGLERLLNEQREEHAGVVAQMQQQLQDYIAEGEIARQFQIESAAEDALLMQKNHAAALAHMTLAFDSERGRFESELEQARVAAGELQDQLRLTMSDLEVSRAALADSKATIADVTRLRWEVESRESDLKQQLAAVLAERDDSKAKLQLQRDDSVQLLLQFEQEKGDKERLDWLVSEGKKQAAAVAQSLASMTKDRDAAVGQVELLRAKLDQANNKNDVLRENYEMLDTKLTQTEEKAAADARLIAQLQKEERRLKEEIELTKVQMQLIVNKTQALQKQMISADGSSHSTEQQLRQALMAAERSEADALVQLEDKTRSLNLAKQQHAAEVQAIVAQHAKDKVAMEGRIRRLEVHNEQLLDQRDKLMKQRDAALSSRGGDGRGQNYGFNAGDSGQVKRDEADLSAAAAAAAATAAAAAAQQRVRWLEDKVADVEAKLEHALAEKDRCEQDAIMCAAHAQEAAANVEQMAAIVKERAKDVEMTKRRITVLEEACKAAEARACQAEESLEVIMHAASGK